MPVVVTRCTKQSMKMPLWRMHDLNSQLMVQGKHNLSCNVSQNRETLNPAHWSSELRSSNPLPALPKSNTLQTYPTILWILLDLLTPQQTVVMRASAVKVDVVITLTVAVARTMVLATVTSRIRGQTLRTAQQKATTPQTQTPTPMWNLCCLAVKGLVPQV
eukprot:Rmarinus@m.24384